MPIKTDLNVSPYFDDFNSNNQYYRVLFRPSVAVQARELTQVQSIFQNQIEQFANWAFKSGDIVANSGCSITDDKQVPFVRLADFQSNGHGYNVSELANVMVYSTTSNLHASVLYARFGLTGSYPNTKAIYLKYDSTGDGAEKAFVRNETLTFYKGPTSNVIAVINTYANTTGQNTAGFGHGIHVSDGIVYLNGTFVQVLNPTYGIVKPFDTYAGNTVVGFQAVESIVTDNQDKYLLDNALGYPNENAPGAHRLKIQPVIVALDPEIAATTKNFVPIASYNYGKLYNKQSSTDINSKLQDAIAKRTYEESGNYVVKPFTVDTVTQTGGTDIDDYLDANTVHARIHPGTGYAQGYRVNRDTTTYVNMRRGVDTQTNYDQQITFGYGNYFTLNEVAGSFAFDQAQTVKLYDAPQTALTQREYNTLSLSGNQIGTAQMRCFSFNGGMVGTSGAQYNLHVFNIKMNSGYNPNQIKSVYYDGAVKGVGDVVGTGVQEASAKDMLFSFGVNGLKNLQDTLGNYNAQYVYRTKSATTLNTDGTVSVTLASSHAGGTDILPYGLTAAGNSIPDSDAINFALIAKASVDSASLGTATVSNLNTTVTGTAFKSYFAIGDQIKVGSYFRTITNIASDTSLTVDSVWPAPATGSFYKTYRAGKIIPITKIIGGPACYIEITSSTTFVIHISVFPASQINVDVIYDVLRSSTLTPLKPAKKEIKKNRFVKINMDTNKTGPWCLGFSDIHQVRNVYGSVDGFYGTDKPNITNLFTYGTGQRDTHYDLGYLYPGSGFSSSTANTLLVELDYFAANTTEGVGFFTVESYPIDDDNTANTTAITTSNIPLYIDESGRKIPLRDYIDFRTPSVPTAADATVVGSATINPSSTLTLDIPGTGLNVPSYSKNMQTDYTFYLPRKDLIIVAPDPNSTGGIIKVKEGLSSISPQTPLYPENAMTIAVINVPPYPSLSSDQLDTLLPINKLSKNLIRDTSLSISSSNVSNRRYTMRDVAALDSRITNLEYYASLSILEKKATDMTITDANGLNRFKNGIFVDTFNDFTKSEVSNPEYSLAINSAQQRGRPRIIREVINIDLNNSFTEYAQQSGRGVGIPAGGYTYSLQYTGTAPFKRFIDNTNGIQKTGRLVTLPYEEWPFLIQPYATKYRSSAHVSLAWNGNVVLIPEYDNHNDIHNTGSINITVDLTTPWKDFAKTPFGSIWGDWNTVSVDTDNTVTTAGGNLDYLDLGSLGFSGSWIYNRGARLNSFTTFTSPYASLDIEARAVAKIHQMYGKNVVIGSLVINHLSDIRLKKDISIIGKLLNGLNLYRYRYLWSDIFYVGVMAQEVQKVIPEAVVYDNSGYMKVNYAKVGIPFLTWEQWLNTNSSAV